MLVRPPELLQSTKNEEGFQPRLIQTTSADMYAFGVLLFELLAQKYPFFDQNVENNISLEELIKIIINSPPSELPDHYPLSLKKLVKQLLSKNPSQRTSAEEILEMPEVIAIVAKQ
ncbi:MAG: hypothetical protein EZS28_007736 [Streblomastix strix]|uniref:non-specific serine/threonine protein kinase n=1 Tax=Streblomastix strix TaxID=222440 RepID=A0A5J4WQA8_9EUKA|nr:MAG: hypothetical protein EZS28_007736 [Streblomastix strix]